ncbi:MAG: 4'-phosphopantetheinyl transferase superfamily protein [Desulfurivibrionaceae bacterium]
MAFVQAIFEECWPLWQQYFNGQARLRLGMAPLAALAGCAPDDYLGPDELARWTGFSLEKRRSEWLGGRLSAKWAAAGLLGKTAVDWQGLIIHSEKDGRPCLATEAHAVVPFISISHSGHLAAALAANCPCGLDLQQPSPKINPVKKRFAGPEEENLLAASLPRSFSETDRLTMLWAAKEAVRKMVRTSPLLGLLEIRLLSGHGGQGTPASPLALTFASGREQHACPASVSVLCFFADNLAWAIACPVKTIKNEK